MPYRIGCPKCNATLKVPEEVRDRWITCPRCLASVMNPDRGVTEEPVIEPPEPRRLSEDDSPTCRECGEEVEARWRYCPYCLASLRGGSRYRSIKRADADAKDDLGWIGFCMVAAGLLGLFSLIALPVLGTVSISGEAVIVIGGGILILVLAGMGIGIASRDEGARTGVSIMGGITVGIVLACLIPIAFCMGLVNGCR